MPLSLRQNTPISDTNSNLAYSVGDWQLQNGSTRQYDGNVHATSNYGATLAFNFQGQAFIIYATIPPGSTNVIVDVSIDGGSPMRLTVASGANAVYADEFYVSPVINFDTHSVVLTNRGRTSDSAFLFDEVVLYAQNANQDNPTLLSPPEVQPQPNPAVIVTPPTTSTLSTTNIPVIPPPIATLTKTATTTQTTAITSIQSQDTATLTSTNTQTATSVVTQSVVSTDTSISTAPTKTPFTVVEEATTVLISTDQQGATVTRTEVFTTSFVTNTETGISTSEVASRPSSSGALLWGLIGGLLFLLLLLSGLFLIRRRRRAQRNGSTRLEDEKDLISRKLYRRADPTIPQPFRLDTPTTLAIGAPLSTSHNEIPFTTLYLNEKMGHNSSEQSESDHTELDSPSTLFQLGNTSGPDSPEAGYTPAAQLASAPTLLSDPRGLGSDPPLGVQLDQLLRSNSISSAASSSMYASTNYGQHTEDVPPPYQPANGSTRLSDFKTRSQMDRDSQGPS